MRHGRFPPGALLVLGRNWLGALLTLGRNQVGNSLAAARDGNGLATLNRPQQLGKARFGFRRLHLAHSPYPQPVISADLILA